MGELWESLRLRARALGGGSMNAKKCALAIAGALLTIYGLTACSHADDAASAPKELAVYTVDVRQPFEGREPRDAAELDVLVADAVALVEQRQAQMTDDAEEAELSAKVNEKFNKANEAYRAGEYAKAQKRYEKVLETYPLHYGANINLTLALLQQEKSEEALVQALSCIELAPGEDGVFLNIQAAGVACGFSTDDLEVAMDNTLDGLGRASYGAGEGYDEEFGPYYLYNKLWDHIETDLAAGEISDAEEGEGSAASAATAGSRAYDSLDSKLTNLEAELPDDTDVSALHAYLYVVGLQLGYEADPLLIEPVHTMPYVAVDSELCTIEIEKITQSGGHWMLRFSLANKTDDKLGVGHGGVWQVNGADVNMHLGQVAIEPGETCDLTLELTARDGSQDQEVSSFTGTFVVSSRTSNSVLAVYPVSWSAAE